MGRYPSALSAAGAIYDGLACRRQDGGHQVESISQSGTLQISPAGRVLDVHDLAPGSVGELTELTQRESLVVLGDHEPDQLSSPA
jgi:hypothetical protein